MSLSGIYSKQLKSIVNAGVRNRSRLPKKFFLDENHWKENSGINSIGEFVQKLYRRNILSIRTNVVHEKYLCKSTGKLKHKIENLEINLKNEC